MTRAWNAYNLQEFSPPERANHLLTIAVDELKKKPPPNEQQTELFTNIRFAIFNYVPWKHFESRTTVSYFNFTPTIIQKEPIRNTNIAKMLEDIEREEEIDLSHKVILDSEEVAGVNGEVFQTAWRRRWNEYLSYGALMEYWETPFSFWNEFLLNHSEYPRNLGVIWNRMGSDLSKISGDYVVEETLSNLHQIELYGSELKRFVETHGCKLDENAIRQVGNIRKWSVPTHRIPEEFWKSSQAIERALTSLYWGFGIWGASSFISLPVTYASSSIGRTGVLSLGSILPLETPELAKWTLIANCVLGTLLNLEAEARIIRSTTQYVYRVGHPFKNRANSIARYSSNLLKEFQRLIGEHQGEMSVDLRRGLERHVKHMRGLRNSGDKMAGFGSLVNFLSALSIENNVWSDKRSKRWLTEEPTHVCDLIRSVARDSFHGERGETRLNLKFSPEMENSYFCCHVNNNSSSTYLGGELLSAIFFELTVNAIHHGMAIGGEVILEISCTGDLPQKALTLTNRVEFSSLRSSLRQNAVEYDIHGAGGETLAGHLLSELILGAPKLRKKIYEEDGGYYFQYIVDLPVKWNEVES